MTPKTILFTTLSTSVIALSAIVGADTKTSSSEALAFPTGYRSWHHVKTEVWGEGHPLYEDVGGMHHIYANALALEGYGSNKFDDGAVLVFDLLDFGVHSGATIEGRRKALFVMVRDQETYSETGGWGFEGFTPTGDVMGIAGTAETACMPCHAGSADTHYVVSRNRD